MKLLPRLRYILEVVRPSPRVVQDVLEILTRIARHSSSSATQVASITDNFIQFLSTILSVQFIIIVLCFSHSQVLDCPRLMEMVLSEFLPTSWTPSSSPLPQSVYGLPLASAMKLLRVLATSGRHACARLVSAAVESVRDELCLVYMKVSSSI